jgi:hypothetical protein
VKILVVTDDIFHSSSFSLITFNDITEELPVLMIYRQWALRNIRGDNNAARSLN